MDKIKPCLYEEKKSLKFELEFSKLNKIGRGTSPKARDITISLLNDSVSSNHAVIQFRKGKWFFLDESTHGSHINNELILQKEQLLQHKDKINIGEYEFSFFDENIVDIIGGTRKVTTLDDSFKARVSQIQSKPNIPPKWKDDHGQEISVLTVLGILLLIIFFVGLFSTFFIDI